MAIIKWDPFAELNALHDQLNSVFNDSFSHRGLQHLAPVTDIYNEGDKQLVVELHLPNFDEKDIEVSVHEGLLEIRAEHHESEKEGDKKRTYLMRESTSSFYRRVVLPKQADPDNVGAAFAKGVLKVTVPFRALPAPKKIPVQPAEAKKK